MLLCADVCVCVWLSEEDKIRMREGCWGVRTRLCICVCAAESAMLTQR